MLVNTGGPEVAVKAQTWGSSHPMKRSAIVLAAVEGTDEVKYIHGKRGMGTWTFLGGHDPDDMIVVLSDINMPVMNGLELLRATKSINPELPVVMVTANGDRETERLAREGGALSLLTKPVDFGQLREKLNELAGGR